MVDDVAAVGRTRVLVLASTFPAADDDPVPAFVRDQIIAMDERYPELEFSVLAPHDERSATRDFSKHASYDEYRFHYFWPRSAEKLAGRGIMPALRENKALFAVVPFLFIGEFFATLKLVRRVRPEIMYAHWFTPQALVASWVSRITRVPFVFTTHASDVDVWRRIPFFGPRIVRSATSRAKAVTAVSSRSREKLTRFFGDAPITVPLGIIPMGVPVPDVSITPAEKAAERARLGLTAETIYLFIGRIVEKKGVPYLLEALSTASDLGDYQLVIAGDGPLLDETRTAVTALGLDDRVVFTGFISGDEKDAYFRAADVMVVPSIISSDGDAEGLPVALLEGLAYGLPCIATNESGADDIITDGVDGHLVVQKDARALAAALETVHELGPDGRVALGARARELALSFTWSSIAERHYDFLFAPVLASTKEADRG
jgi:glycosyltransferase involved in cell wall biosynthesis